MPNMCFNYQADVPPGISARGVGPVQRRMPAGHCFSYPAEAPRRMPAASCLSYPDDVRLGTGNHDTAPAGLRSMGYPCFRL